MTTATTISRSCNGERDPPRRDRRGRIVKASARPRVVAVILSYNCARLLPKAYARIPKHLVDEVFVTDDGSTDGSMEVAQSFGVPVVRHTPNRGYGGNLKAGLGHALARGADYVVEVHGDGQFDSAALRDARPLMAQGVDFIMGSRLRVPGRARELGMPLVRYLANRGLSAIDRLVLRLPFTEFHSGFRIYSREMLERVAWEANSDGYLFSFQIIVQAAFARLRTAEVPVEADYLSEHTSHGLAGASWYAIRTFGVLAQFLLARAGLPAGRLLSRPTARASRCRGCGAAGLTPMLDLGAMPLVNSFPAPGASEPERVFPLALAWCARCCLVQVERTVSPRLLFETYHHLSSASRENARHLVELARFLAERFAISARSRVLEIGSNDGTLLGELHGVAGTVVGVDPASNVAPLARERGITAVTDFMTEEVAGPLLRKHGGFDLVIALNVVAHTPDVHALLRDVARVLAPGGVFVMESVDALATVLDAQFDTVYHEHAYTFSLTSLLPLLAGAGLVAVGAARIPTQGGSLRVFARHAGEAEGVDPSVRSIVADEEARGVRRRETYVRVGERARDFSVRFRQALEDLQGRHGRVIGLGAPARGVVLLNCGRVGPELVERVIDDTLMKQGRMIPGCRIPVAAWDALSAEPKPSAFVLLSWNYEQEVLAKLRRFVTVAEILVPLPALRLVRWGLR